MKLKQTPANAVEGRRRYCLYLRDSAGVKTSAVIIWMHIGTVRMPFYTV
jgi:hypothetical protein